MVIFLGQNLNKIYIDTHQIAPFLQNFSWSIPPPPPESPSMYAADIFLYENNYLIFKIISKYISNVSIATCFQKFRGRQNPTKDIGAPSLCH